jgi:hypothetical protein
LQKFRPIDYLSKCTVHGSVGSTQFVDKTRTVRIYVAFVARRQRNRAVSEAGDGIRPYPGTLSQRDNRFFDPATQRTHRRLYCRFASAESLVCAALGACAAFLGDPASFKFLYSLAPGPCKLLMRQKVNAMAHISSWRRDPNGSVETDSP